ncbi:p30-like movement protein [Diuris virus A]|uniref:p30-like movement protein n=1 Tax=Diuris virus A TaxID=1247115 RepID=K4PEV9_9VIRU|nr:p30-like movement protein [Diuris virus A]AFV57239.1 p30-like movement protein [Diuris virus A]
MQVVDPKAFIQKFDNGGRNIDCIRVSEVYSDGGFIKNEKVDAVQRTESSISIKSINGESRIIKGIPIIDPNVIDEERNKKKYSKVNIGAIIISIHKLGYYEREMSRGRCLLVDGRRSGGGGIIKAFEFDISKGPAHFVLVPNAVFDIHDELLDRACEVFIIFDNVNYRGGSYPFAIEIGAIYRMSNVFNCYHRMGVPGRKGSIGSIYQEVHCTKTISEEDEESVLSEMCVAREAGRISDAERSFGFESERGKRSLIMPWRKRGPSFFRDYSVGEGSSETEENLCRVRSSTGSIDERDIPEKVLDNKFRSASERRKLQSNFREASHGRSSCKPRSVKLDKRDDRVPGGSLWREVEEIEEEDITEAALGECFQGVREKLRAREHPSGVHGC